MDGIANKEEYSYTQLCRLWSGGLALDARRGFLGFPRLTIYRGKYTKGSETDQKRMTYINIVEESVQETRAT